VSTIDNLHRGYFFRRRATRKPQNRSCGASREIYCRAQPMCEPHRIMAFQKKMFDDPNTSSSGRVPRRLIRTAYSGRVRIVFFLFFLSLFFFVGRQGGSERFCTNCPVSAGFCLCSEVTVFPGFGPESREARAKMLPYGGVPFGAKEARLLSAGAQSPHLLVASANQIEFCRSSERPISDGGNADFPPGDAGRTPEKPFCENSPWFPACKTNPIPLGDAERRSFFGRKGLGFHGCPTSRLVAFFSCIKRQGKGDPENVGMHVDSYRKVRPQIRFPGCSRAASSPQSVPALPGRLRPDPANNILPKQVLRVTSLLSIFTKKILLVSILKLNTKASFRLKGLLRQGLNKRPFGALGGPLPTGAWIWKTVKEGFRLSGPSCR